MSEEELHSTASRMGHAVGQVRWELPGDIRAFGQNELCPIYGSEASSDKMIEQSLGRTEGEAARSDTKLGEKMLRGGSVDSRDRVRTLTEPY